MSVLTVYGIKSCDTCRKALKWLDEQGREYRWQDLRADGLTPDRLQRWMEAIGPDVLVNRRSTTWRTLGEIDRARVADHGQAIEVLLAHPTLIKRPVFAQDERVLVGFNATVRDSL
ncbi:MAG: Spx/MgsR family RNA polymerase-binding regulatory protein [Wenzhouxiangella sp.]